MEEGEFVKKKWRGNSFFFGTEGEFILIFINYYLNSFYTHTLILLCLIEIHKKKTHTN
jgi:hypothetical protein